MKIESFEDIASWKEARALTNSIYRHTKRGDFARDYALRDQIRRASTSIMSNIAEGFERGGDKEFLQFLSTAKGSCGEVRSHLYVALDQEYITPNDFAQLREATVNIGRLIGGFMKYLQGSPLRGSKYSQESSKQGRPARR